MKIKITIILLLLFFSFKAQCQECVVQPLSYEFKSTSNQFKNEYTIPFAAKDINVYNGTPNGIKRGRSIDDDDIGPGFNPSDPGMTPIEDGKLIMIIFILIYTILRIKNNNELTKYTS